MTEDGRLMPAKVFNGRPYYAQGNLDEALRRRNFTLRMDIFEVSEFTGLKIQTINILVNKNLFPRPNRDYRFLRGEVFAWWDNWLGSQSPFDDEDRNRGVRQSMDIAWEAEERRRTEALRACKCELERKNRLRIQSQARSRQ